MNTVALYGIHFSDSLNGWVARGIKPYKTTDGGETWVEQTNFPVSGARDVFFIDRFKGFICRTNELYKSVDAGINWSLVAEVTNFAFGRFSNLSANLFLAGGPRSYQSTDSGENWTEVVELRNKLVEFIRLSNVNEGFAVGWRGLILQYTDSVVSVRENNINVPAKYYLYQNYPNPFNPSTKIKYTVPSVTLRQAQSDINVTLKVYDILGKEITTLVNEEKPAGTYEVEFNSHSGEVRNLPSGVYFYRLKAGAYIETKKMVLLK
ncbi:MAG: T9SS type A sorting domain-containing protein [Ignavibacteriaceae bacterium]|nr:T9SS type A sorting domain-containing protein [Chlorobium sp.]MCW8823074.1 T9SS type A sorting domain-containing protein [Ignavibacteriaceae bacterium]